MFGLIILGVGAIALAFLATRDSKAENRQIWLMTGKRYSILVNSPYSSEDNAAQLTSMGFVIEAEQPLPPGGIYQYQAFWNGQPMLWLVPTNVSIGEL